MRCPMSQTENFIARLAELKEGHRSRVRCLGGKRLDEDVWGFDLFTGLWWPLRQQGPAAPRRGASWLLAKLYCVVPIPQRGSSLAWVLGQLEPHNDSKGPAFRRRFDALLCSGFNALEPHLAWALRQIGVACKRGQLPEEGIDWALLLDDVSLWDRGYNPDDPRQQQRLAMHRQLVRCQAVHRAPQDLWACEYFVTCQPSQGVGHVD
ncbi:MAG: type I-E CRISPR-associated protein Cse2/CasB [Thermoguttaceae bacterium]